MLDEEEPVSDEYVEEKQQLARSSLDQLSPEEKQRRATEFIERLMKKTQEFVDEKLSAGFRVQTNARKTKLFVISNRYSFAVVSLSVLSRRRRGDDYDEEESAVDSSIPILAEQPPILTGAKLRDYQMEGLNWLIRLYHKGLNGILADEMVRFFV